MLMDMKRNTGGCNLRCFQTLLEILDYYRIYASKICQKTIPKEVALLHNNFKYISHEIKNWNTFYSDILDNGIPPFKFEAFQFQSIAEEVFNKFVTIQKMN
ncbi:hypothetical protein HHI36_008373 [Cryptolaemus montrouzieri]